MDERRIEQRQRTLKGGKILFAHAAAIDCTVRNLSAQGACLVVASPIGIPDRFKLELSNDHSIRACRVIWRSQKQVGIFFE